MTRIRSLHLLEYAIVQAVDDVQRSFRIDVDAVRLVELDLFGRTAHAGCAGLARPGDAHELPVFRPIPADDMIIGIGNDYRAVAVETQVLRAAQRGGQRGPVGIGRPRLARPRDRANLPCTVDDTQG